MARGRADTANTALRIFLQDMCFHTHNRVAGANVVQECGEALPPGGLDCFALNRETLRLKRLPGFVFVRDYIRYHDRDVVRSAATQRQFD